VTHIPEPGQVMQRYYGWYASRTRGARRRGAPEAAEAPVVIADPIDWSLRAARLRWAELLRRIFEVDPLACPHCRGLMRIVAVITDPAVIARILAHRARARDPATGRGAHRRAGDAHPPRPWPIPPTRNPRSVGGGGAGVPGCPGGGGPPTPDCRADLRADPNGSRATPRSRPGRRVGPRAHHSVPSSGRRKSLSVIDERASIPSFSRRRDFGHRRPSLGVLTYF
jgi:hypothetical protein